MHVTDAEKNEENITQDTHCMQASRDTIGN